MRLYPKSRGQTVKSEIRLAAIIPKKCIVLELEATENGDAIAELVAKLVDTGRLPKSQQAAVSKAILAREKLGTTGIGRGIAIPHARLPKVEKLVGALGRSKTGLDFKSLDGEPIHAVFLFVVPAEPADIAYGLMSRMAELVRMDNFARFLQQSETVDALHEVLTDSESW